MGTDGEARINCIECGGHHRQSESSAGLCPECQRWERILGRPESVTIHTKEVVVIGEKVILKGAA